jgi:hypothetical protein
VGASKSSKDVTLCAVKKSGELSLASHSKCGKGEKKLTIAKQGPVGPVGPAGSAANVTPEPITLVKLPATTACQTNPGTFCAPGSLSGTWQNASEVFGGNDAPVGFYKDASGIVHLTGVAVWSSSGGESGGYVPPGPFYLPPGYRPPATEVFVAATGSGLEATTKVEILPDGAVATPKQLVSLSGITFRP